MPHRDRQTWTRTALAVVAFALALPALLLLGSATPTDTDYKSIMVVRYACMACQSCCSADSHSTTYQQAASHYANSHGARYNQSVRGIATVVLPSRPLTLRQVAPELQGHGLACQDAGGLCKGSGSALEVISCSYIIKTSMISSTHYIIVSMISGIIS